MVVRQLKIRLSVPRPGDSKTQPTSACVVGEGLALLLDGKVMLNAPIYILLSFIGKLYKD